MASGCCLNIKIGEAPRPSTYQLPAPKKTPVTHEEAWQMKSQFAKAWFPDSSDDANDTAKAWLSHPANKMQLPGLQKAHDADGDGVTNRSEFESLLKAAGSAANADRLFNAMDADGDGFLSEAEIKALGQDASGRARNRGGP